MKNLILLGALLLTHLAGYAQLQNTDFENWVNPINNTWGTNRPVNWTRVNGIPNNPYINFFHPPVSAAQNGNSALRLSIWYTYDLDMAVQVAPINYRPYSLTGFYTYTDNKVYDDDNVIIDDVAIATVRLTKLNPATGNAVLVGLGVVQLTTAQTYTPFTCVINYVSNDIPDTVEVEFDCTLMDKMNGPTVTPVNQLSISSVLTIDNIKLTTQALAAQNFSLNYLKIYPNPTTGTVNFPEFEGTVTVYDISGKIIKSTNTNLGSINVNNLEAGVYILSFTNADGTYNTKIIKK